MDELVDIKGTVKPHEILLVVDALTGQDAVNVAKGFNEKLGVSKAQEQAMLAGSMIRWDSIAAKPKSYDENGKAIKPKDYER